MSGFHVRSLCPRSQSGWGPQSSGRACVSETRPLFKDEALAEDHFVWTHRRTPDGRFLVRLPFKSNTFGADLGLSCTQGRVISSTCRSVD